MGKWKKWQLIRTQTEQMSSNVYLTKMDLLIAGMELLE